MGPKAYLGAIIANNPLDLCIFFYKKKDPSKDGKGIC